MNKKLRAGILATTMTIISSNVYAENHEVKVMGTKFVPDVLRIAKGDTVSFVNMLGHNVQTIDEYLPKLPGIAPEDWDISFKSDLSENYITPELMYDGVYILKCQPHWSMGMGVSIIVGKHNPTNLDDIKTLNPKGSAKRMIKKTEKFLKKEAKMLKDKAPAEIAEAIVANPNGYTSETLKLAEEYLELKFRMDNLG